MLSDDASFDFEQLHNMVNRVQLIASEEHDEFNANRSVKLHSLAAVFYFDRSEFIVALRLRNLHSDLVAEIYELVDKVIAMLRLDAFLEEDCCP